MDNFLMRMPTDLIKTLSAEAKKNNITRAQLIRDKCMFNPSKQNFQKLEDKLNNLEKQLKSQKIILENIETEQTAQNYLVKKNFQDTEENFQKIEGRDKKFYDSIFTTLMEELFYNLIIIKRVTQKREWEQVDIRKLVVGYFKKLLVY